MTATTAWGLDAVKRRSATDHVREQLRSAILAGRIGPREPLPEVALATSFGTGRSAIREALRQLVQEGLVVSEVNRGARVRALSTDDVVDVYRARDAIETAAVTCVAARRPAPADLEPLHMALGVIADACASSGEHVPSPELIAADLDFHRALVALADSPRLSRAYEPLAAESQMLLNWHPTYAPTSYVDDHRTLLDALTDGDGDPAAAVHEHLRLSRELILEEAARYADRLDRTPRLLDGEEPSS